MPIIIGVFSNIQFNTVDLYGMFIYPYNVCFFTTILPIYISFFVLAIGFHTTKNSVTRGRSTIIQISSYSICAVRRWNFLNDLLPFYTLNVIKSPINTVPQY